jgi:hypothetical protein
MCRLRSSRGVQKPSCSSSAQAETTATPQPCARPRLRREDSARSTHQVRSLPHSELKRAAHDARPASLRRSAAVKQRLASRPEQLREARV